MGKGWVGIKKKRELPLNFAKVPISFYQNWLPGQDSNLQPSGYKNSQDFFWAWTISSPSSLQ